MRSLTAYDVRSHDDVNLELVGLPFSTNTPLCERLFLSYFWAFDRKHNDFVGRAALSLVEYGDVRKAVGFC